MRKLSDLELLDKLLARADQAGGPDACWPITTGWRNLSSGYALVRFHGQTTTAHRAIYLIKNGLSGDTVPVVRHSCDNPPCANPTHLLGGSHKQNNQDMLDRSRNAKTYRPHTRVRKLTDDQVRAIRRDVRPLNVVAFEHRISESVVSMIRRGKAKQLVPD